MERTACSLRVPGLVLLLAARCAGNTDVPQLGRAVHYGHGGKVTHVDPGGYRAAPAAVAKQAPTVGKGKPRHCGATSPPKGPWRKYGSSGLYMDIVTAHCHFDTDGGVPQYVATLVGNANYWQLTPSNSVTNPTRSSFRVIALHPSMRGQLLIAAAKYQWRVGWIGGRGSNTGRTALGHTGWRQRLHTAHDAHIVFADIDTSGCKFGTAPRYFTAVQGFIVYWRTLGAHTVYRPTAQSFRIYLVYHKPVTAAQAEGFKWAISWIGVEDGADEKWKWVKTGESDPKRWAETHPKGGLFVDVDTTKSGFRSVPTYVSSVTTNYQHWNVWGAASVYRPDKTSFRLYLDQAMFPKFATLYRWRVNYLGFDGPVDCAVSRQWRKWSKCSQSCNGGTQHRSKWVLQMPANGGSPCPTLTESRYCNKIKCPPSPCQVSSWATWSTCPKTCGRGVQRHSRYIKRKAEFGGTACPELSERRYCNTKPCPVDCAVSQWSKWSACSVRCGVGVNIRNRVVHVHAAHNGTACPTELSQTKPCNEGDCVGRGPSRLCGHTTQAQVDTGTVSPSAGVGGGRRRLADGIVTGVASHAGNKPATGVQPGVWHKHGSHGIYVHIDTSHCGWTVGTEKLAAVGKASAQAPMLPIYAASLRGDARCPFVGFVRGAGAIVSRRLDSFKYVLAYKQLSAMQLLSYARFCKWQVSWIGDSGSNTGLTIAGSTKWKQTPSPGGGDMPTSVYADVDTSPCKFPISQLAPLYFTAIGSPTDDGQWRTHGAQIVHMPRRHAFRVYVSYDKPLTAADAEAKQWVVTWIGMLHGDGKSEGRGTGKANTAAGVGSFGGVGRRGIGSSNGNWLRDTGGRGMYLASEKKYIPSGTGAYIDVDTDAAGFTATPAYVTALASPNLEWALSGTLLQARSCAACSFQSIFRLYLGRLTSIPFLKAHRWRVNYIGYQAVDCRVSEWSEWSPCSQTCGIGQQQRRRKVVQLPEKGGLPCPKLFQQHRRCNTFSCIGNGPPKLCGGTTPLGDTDWRVFGSTGLYLDIDTARCRFKTPGFYVATLVADRSHWRITSPLITSRRRPKSFRVSFVHPGVHSVALLEAAKAYNWQVSWVADSGSNAGITNAGATGWRQETTHTVYSDVDTSLCGFDNKQYYPSPPLYFTSLAAQKQGVATAASGSHIHYFPKRNGFRVYLTLSAATTAAMAEKAAWTVTWIGTARKHAGSQRSGWQLHRVAVSSGVAALAGAPAAAAAGKPLLKVDGLLMDVDAASSKFRLAPSFVSSVSATTSHQALAGAGTIYSPTRRGFHIYLGAAPGVKQSSSYWEDFLASVGGTDAANSAWHVNYLGYEGDSCPVTRWRPWSKCTQGDDGVYRQRRQRNTMQARKCFIPMLIEQRHCTPRKPTPAPSPPPTPLPTPKRTSAPTHAPTPDFSVFHAAVTMTATLLGQSLLPSTSDGATHAAGAGSKISADATRRAHFCEAAAMAFGVSRDRVSIHTVRAVDARGKAAAGVQLGSLVTFRVLARTQYAADLLAAKSQAASFHALLAAELSLKLQHPFTATSLALSYPIAAAYAVPGSVNAMRTAQSSAQQPASTPASAPEVVNIPGVGMVEKRQIWLAALGAIGLLYLGAALGWLVRKMRGDSIAAPSPSSELPLRAAEKSVPPGVDLEQTQPAQNGRADDVFGAWPSLQHQNAGEGYGGAGTASILDDDDPDL